MPRCGTPYPPNPASTCTKVPNHDGPHQVYWKDSLYDWRSTPPPTFLPSLSPNGDGDKTRSTPTTTRGGQS